MKIISKKYYVCGVCDCQYVFESAALECEAQPTTQDKGVVEGDIVMITGGQGAGCKAKVTDVYVIDKYWGHHSWKRYWHTVAITADLIDGSGTRTLTFDDYVTT
jgi:hypothetical protein